MGSAPPRAVLGENSDAGACSRIPSKKNSIVRVSMNRTKQEGIISRLLFAAVAWTIATVAAVKIRSVWHLNLKQFEISLILISVFLFFFMPWPVFQRKKRPPSGPDN